MKKISLTLLILFSLTTSAFAEVVVFNSQNKKVHKPTCEWAKKCKKNCIKIEHTDAYKKGGIKCKSCGG